MFLHKFGIVVVFILFCNVQYVFNTKVYLLFPKGFSINVEHNSNITDVTFDVTIIKNDENLTVINYNKHVRYNFANTWTFVKRNVALEIGDSIVYKITIHEKGAEQLKDSGTCKVTELPKLGALRKHGWTFNYDILLDCTEGDDVMHGSVDLQLRGPDPMEDVKTKLQECQGSIFNASLSLLQLEIEVQELRNLTQQLVNFEETYPLAKQLTLAGRIPPDGDPTETVSFILYEKLDLRPKIVSAFRDSTYSIRFTVSNIIEKIEILEVGKYTLASTQITIT